MKSGLAWSLVLHALVAVAGYEGVRDHMEASEASPSFEVRVAAERAPRGRRAAPATEPTAGEARRAVSKAAGPAGSGPNLAEDSDVLGQDRATADYLATVRLAVESKLRRPRARLSEPKVTRLRVALDSSGHASSVWVEAGSGDEKLDARARAAVLDAAPFPPVPSARNLSFLLPVEFR